MVLPFIWKKLKLENNERGLTLTTGNYAFMYSFDQARPLTHILQVYSPTCVIMDNAIHCKPVCNSKRLEIT